MKEITVHHDFDIGLETLVKVRELRYLQPEQYPEIKKVEDLDHKETETDIIHIRRVSLRANIPSPAEKLMKDKTIIAMETSRQKKDFSFFYVYTEFSFLNEALTFSQESDYVPLGENKSRRTILIKSNCTIPFIGKTLESVIASEFKKRSDDDRQWLIKAASSS